MEKLEKISKYIESGLSVIPCLNDKRPAIKWTRYQEEIPAFNLMQDTYNQYNNFALICGKVSGGVEVVDVDCKYDLDGDLAGKLSSMLKKQITNFTDKVVIQKTVNKGYHLIYRCDEIEGNQKLAFRSTTEQEKLDNPKEKRKVLIETRGEKGYILVPPSKGYEIFSGDLNNIPKITPEERQTILRACKSFSEYDKTDVLNELRKTHEMLNTDGQKRFNTIKSPLDDYNENGDVVGLLQKHGWTVVFETKDRVALKRPGNTKTKHSAYYDKFKKWFTVFSSSTEFETEKAYLPYAVYAVLECKGDYGDAVIKLSEEGYGESELVETESNREYKKEKTKPKFDKWEDLSFLDLDESLFDIQGEDLPFLSKEEDEDDYFDMIENNGLEMGLTTGIPELDKYYRHKQGNFVIINGLDNVGKTFSINYLMALCSLINKWKFLAFCAENKEGQIRRNFIQFATGKHYNELSSDDKKKWRKWSYEHLYLIKVDGIYNYRNLLVMAKEVCDKKPVNAIFIDPYNSLDVDLSKEDSRMTEHNYHYKAYTYFRQFCRQFNISIYLSMHPYTGASRNYDKEGFIKPPTKADTEGGQKAANRADDFITMHRYVDDSTRRKISKWIVRKIKDTETGGKPTSPDEVVDLELYGGLWKFKESKSGIDPVEQFHKKGYVQKEVDFTTSEQLSKQDEEDLRLLEEMNKKQESYNLASNDTMKNARSPLPKDFDINTSFEEDDDVPF